jgi:hypothetical protein
VEQWQSNDEARGFADDFSDDFEDFDAAGIISGGGTDGNEGSATDADVLGADFADDFNLPPEDSGADIDKDFSADFNTEYNDISNNQPAIERLNGVATVLTSSQISDVETVLDISIEDLDNGVLVSEDEDEDDIAFNELLDHLIACGYKVDGSYDFPTLIKLRDRQNSEQELQEVLHAYTKGFREYTATLTERVAGSKATLEEADSSIDSITYFRNNSYFSTGHDSAIVKAVNNIVQSSILSNSDISVEEVYEKIVNYSAFDKVDSDVYRNEILSFLKEVIPIIKNYHQSEANREMKSHEHRSKIAEFLLREELMASERLKADYDHGRLHITKNIFNLNGKYAIECPQCNSDIMMAQSPVTLIKFATEKSEDNTSFYMFPNSYQCDCGSSVILAPDDYAAIKKQLNSSRTVLNSAIRYSTDFCKGASFIRVSPAISGIITSIDYLVREKSIEALDDNTQDAGESYYSIDDNEMQEAAKRFYARICGLNNYQNHLKSKRLKTAILPQPDIWHSAQLSTSDNSDGSHKEMPSGYKSAKEACHEVAVYFCRMLSMRYKHVKNNAVFSLLLYIKDNPLLEEALNTFDLNAALNRLWALKRVIQLSKSSTDFAECEPYINFLAPLIAEAGISVSYNKVDLKETVHAVVADADKIAEIVRAKQEEFNQTLDFMQENLERFGYCKIINISNFSRFDFMKFTSDRRLFEVIDEITDLMIINNYAGEFYEYWERLGICNTSTLRKALKSRTDKNSALNSVIKQITGFLRSFGSIYLKDFSVIYEPAADEQSSLRAVVKSLSSGNFYKFCREMLKADMNVMDYTVPNETYKLNMAMRNLYQIASKTLNEQSEIEFFLSEMFSQKEIQENIALLETLVFEGVVPVRKENETPPEYIERYLMWQNGKETESGELKSFYGFFRENRHDILIITAASLYSEVEYKSYTPAAFMSKMVNCFLRSNRDCVNMAGLRAMLGLSDEMLCYIGVDDTLITPEDVHLGEAADWMRILSCEYASGVSDFLKEPEKKLSSDSLVTEGDLGEQLSGQNSYLDIFEQLVESLIHGEEQESDRVYNSDFLVSELGSILQCREFLCALRGE